MIELWIPITVAAAFLQNVRSALQKHLKSHLSTSGATFVRFGYGFPLAVIYVAGLTTLADLPIPRPTPTFALYVTVGGLAQILATALLVSLFSQRNFVVGTTYSKTETIQTAVFGIVILGDRLSLGATAGIMISLAGVMAMSVAKSEVTLRGLLLSWTGRAALVGIASGTFFAAAAVSYRAASLSLGGERFVMQAAFTLAGDTVLQTLAMMAYLHMREPGQLAKILVHWRVGLWVGVSGVAASACWFTAMTIQNAAYVRALGQVELLFTFLASHFVFRERATRLEVAGIGLTLAGILCLLLST